MSGSETWVISVRERMQEKTTFPAPQYLNTNIQTPRGIPLSWKQSCQNKFMKDHQETKIKLVNLNCCHYGRIKVTRDGFWLLLYQGGIIIVIIKT